MAQVTLHLSKGVAATTEDATTYIPANGKQVDIISFCGEGAFTPNCAIKLIWDWTGTDTILWSIKGSSKIESLPPVTAANGIKKIALTLDNGETGTVFMSGRVVLEVED